MVPAHEGLHAARLARPQIHDRLEEDDELRFRDRPLELLAQDVPTDDGFAHHGVENGVAALAGGLRLVHRDVGVAQEVLGAPAAVLARRDPDAETHRQDVRADRYRHLEGMQDAGGDVHGGALGAVRVAAQDREFVATEPGDEVPGANAAGKAVCRGAEELIADRVPERVVHGLEVVEVEEENGDVVVAGREQRLDLLPEQRPVRQPGERIVERLMVEAVLELAKFRYRLLQPVVLQRGACVGGERVKQRQVVARETAGKADAVREHEQADRALLAAELRDHRMLDPAAIEVAAGALRQRLRDDDWLPVIAQQVAERCHVVGIDRDHALTRRPGPEAGPQRRVALLAAEEDDLGLLGAVGLQCAVQ